MKQHSPMTRREMLAYLQEVLCKAGMDMQEAAAEARYALSFVLDIAVSDIYLQGHLPVEEAHQARLMQVLQRRVTGEPLAYILAERYFMGMPFFVQPGVLIPRQETELLCEQAAKVICQKNLTDVLDLCTGSGCIAISLAKLTKAKVEAIDISPIAIQTAQHNAQLLQASVTIYASDLFAQVNGQYDMITANPPYITTQAYHDLDSVVREYEPALALLGGQDGLCFYRRIAAEAPAYLRPGGYLVQEIGYDQGLAVAGLLAERGFCNIRVEKDYAGLDRIVWAQMLCEE